MDINVDEVLNKRKNLRVKRVTEDTFEFDSEGKAHWVGGSQHYENENGEKINMTDMPTDEFLDAIKSVQKHLGVEESRVNY